MDTDLQSFMKEKQDYEASKGTLGSPRRHYIGTLWILPPITYSKRLEVRL
jgi:hypothetical protein